jgi:putative DNA primase/helicase
MLSSPAQIAATLGQARREGRGWRCLCPLHGGHSLVLRDGHQGLLVKCWGGCATVAVLAELYRRELLHSDEEEARHLEHRRLEDNDARRVAAKKAQALKIYREARPIQGTVGEAYLRHRGIVLPSMPTVLRLHLACPHPTGARLPALVALVHQEGVGAVAIHRTFLKPDGSGKAGVDPDKACLGPVGGGAVRLAAPRPGEWLAIGEGIESMLSIMAATGMPAWAAISAEGLRKVILPASVDKVLIGADHDESGVGQHAARDAAERVIAEGRRVRIAIPPEPNTDFNDVLRGDGNLKNMEASDVAA